ncbi:hypothetical protein ACQR50_16235 [Sphingomonas sp. Xoc002]|uniref:hypothetical protein n=1 Tax=Sphingomonas sp. Xoc002 TaxID=2837624 RepID=UPI003D181327
MPRLTTGYEGDPAAHVVGAIHPKAMPVILHDDDYERWLTAPIEDAFGLAAPFPSQLMASSGLMGGGYVWASL